MYSTQDTQPQAAEVPNTPEVQAFKAALYAEATAYGRSRGVTREVEEVLRRLGVQAPPSATISATITLPVRVTVREVFGEGVTAQQARERLAGYSQAQLAREGARHANHNEATVTFEVSDPETN